MKTCNMIYLVVMGLMPTYTMLEIDQKDDGIKSEPAF